MTDKLTSQNPRVGIIMGSRSDWETMHHARVLAELAIPPPMPNRLTDSHPDRMLDYAAGAKA